MWVKAYVTATPTSATVLRYARHSLTSLGSAALSSIGPLFTVVTETYPLLPTGRYPPSYRSEGATVGESKEMRPI